jgi:hypothetical protein
MKTKSGILIITMFMVGLFSIDSFSQTLFQKKYSSTTGVDGIFSGLASGSGIIICGKTTTSPFDAIILKTDLNGVVQWGKKIGGTQDDVFNKIRPTSDGGYITVGYTKSSGAGDKDVLLVKLDQNGGVTWSKTYGTSDIDAGYDVIQTSDGGYAISGFAKKKALTSTDGAIYIIKTNNLGIVTWYRMMGADSQYNGTNIIQNSAGDLICLGTGGSQAAILLKISISGTVSWVRSIIPNELSGISCHQMIQTSDGGFALIGCGPNPTNKDYAGLICLDSNGATKFCKVYTGDIGFSILPPGLQQTWDNGFIITTSDPGYKLI